MGLYQLVGNQISKEIIYNDRINILNQLKKNIQKILDQQESGLIVQVVQLY